MIDGYESVLEFWFETLEPKDWWRKDDELDQRILERFSTLHEKVANGETAHWRTSDEGRLAEIIVLDQFSRHVS